MYRTLLVDDERLARSELKRLLAAHPQCQICAEAASAEEAREIIQREQIDLIFLDIQMPKVTGLELAADITADIQFVFCTAYNSHALDAFSLNAVDYLLKPVEPERLAKTIQRLRPPRTAESQVYLPDSHSILLKFGDLNRIVRLAEIHRFESIGNHAAVYTPYGKSFIHSSLARIEQKLNPSSFFKASRSDIVRLDALSHIEAAIESGALIACLKDGQQVAVSRRQAQALKSMFAGL